MPPSIHSVTLRARAAFTLVELMVVIVVITMMTAASGPVLQSLTGSASVNKASDELLGTYEMARVYAMSHHTFTRVGIAPVAASADFSLPSLVVATICSVDGSLTHDDAASMADNAKWKLVDKPRVLTNLWIYDSLEASSPSTAADTKVSAADIDPFSRKAGGAGTLSFGFIVQFNPAGEARVLKTEPARFIKIGIDQPLNASSPNTSPRKHNPFILRLSGINGTLNVIRKENIL